MWRIFDFSTLFAPISLAARLLAFVPLRKQICDFVHIVEVSDSARDRLQGLHHCFFGWRTFSRLQLLQVCEPLSQRQQQFRLISARYGLGKPLVKRSRVLSCARKDLFVQHSRESRCLTTGQRQ